jgi:hypothetical protein
MASIEPPQPIVCSIVQQESGNRVELRGSLTSREKAQGHYSFRVSRTGPSGSSIINQAGPFSAPANTRTLVGSAGFDREPHARLTALLTLHVGGRTYHCAQPKGGAS